MLAARVGQGGGAAFAHDGRGTQAAVAYTGLGVLRSGLRSGVRGPWSRGFQQSPRRGLTNLVMLPFYPVSVTVEIVAGLLGDLHRHYRDVILMRFRREIPYCPVQFSNQLIR